MRERKGGQVRGENKKKKKAIKNYGGPSAMAYPLIGSSLVEQGITDKSFKNLEQIRKEKVWKGIKSVPVSKYTVQKIKKKKKIGQTKSPTQTEPSDSNLLQPKSDWLSPGTCKSLQQNCMPRRRMILQ